jgi:hypothetical protein
LRFTPGAFVQERYLFFIAPLLFVAALMLLSEGGRHWGVLAAGGALGAWLVGQASYVPSTVIIWASPASAFHKVLDGRSWQVSHWLGTSHISAGTLMRLGTIPIVLAVGALLHFGRARVALVLVGTLLCAFLLLETRYVMNNFAVPSATRPARLPYSERDWIDKAVPGSARVAMLPGLQPGADAFWDAELWNKTVDHAYTANGVSTFTPFPSEALDLSAADGTLRGVRKQLPWLVIPSNEVRVGLAGAREVASSTSLLLQHVDTPYRMDWVTRSGVYDDGWTEGGKPVVVDVFAPNGEGGRRRQVSLSLLSTAGILKKQPFTISVDGKKGAHGVLAPDSSTTAMVTACPPPSGHSRVVLTIPRAVQISDGRSAGLHLDGVGVKDAGSC